VLIRRIGNLKQFERATLDGFGALKKINGRERD